MKPGLHKTRTAISVGMTLTLAGPLIGQPVHAKPLNGQLTPAQGMNLVGIPVAEGTTAADLFGRFGDASALAALEWLDANGNGFEQCRLDAQETPLDAACDDPVAAGQAWFVQADAPPSQVAWNLDIPCPTLALHPGQNLASFPCAAPGLTARILLFGLGLPEPGSAVQRFDTATGRWVSVAHVNGDLVGEDFPILPGEGYLLSIATATGFADRDGDGVRDEREDQDPRLDPDNPDSDDDGLIDGLELLLDTEPNERDSDGDGIDDGDEIDLGTDPTEPDTDGDGLTDGDEVDLHGTDPTDPDSDHDGFVDGDEVRDGSNPNDPNDIPGLVGDPPRIVSASFSIFNPGGGTDPVTNGFSAAYGSGFSVYNAGVSPPNLDQDNNLVLDTTFSIYNAGVSPPNLSQDNNLVLDTTFSIYNGGASPGNLGQTDNLLATASFSLYNAGAAGLFSLGASGALGPSFTLFNASAPFMPLWLFSIDNGGQGAQANAATNADAQTTDFDADGLPDAYETAHGLDPTDPADALADLDGDGLSNAEEYALGTEPETPDSDGDGRRDGDEMGLDGTDPLDLFDRRASRPLGDARTASGQPAIALDGDGNLHAVWVEYADHPAGTGSVHYRVQAPDGAPLVGDTRLTDTAGASQPALALDPDGNALLAWIDDRDGEARVRVQPLEPGAHPFDGSPLFAADETLPAPIALSAVDGYDARHPALALDADGNGHLVWEDSAGRVQYARLDAPMDADREAAGPVPTPAVATLYQRPTPGPAMHPTLALDAAGIAQVVWAAPAPSGALELYAVAPAADASGPAPRRLGVDDGADSLRPTLHAVDSTLHLAFQDRRTGLDEVRRRALSENGAPDAGASEPLAPGGSADAAGGSALLPALAGRADGGLGLVYAQDPEASPVRSLFYLPLDAAGQALAAPGLLTEGGEGSALDGSEAPRIAAFGPTTYVAWTDRGGPHPVARLVVLHPDPDGDGLSNSRERALGSDKTRFDTDGDGADDGSEATAGSDPTDPRDCAGPDCGGAP